MLKGSILSGQSLQVFYKSFLNLLQNFPFKLSLYSIQKVSLCVQMIQKQNVTMYQIAIMSKILGNKQFAKKYQNKLFLSCKYIEFWQKIINRNFIYKKQIYKPMKNNTTIAPSAQQTLMNPLNSSSSKFQFSFSKADRFYSKSALKNKIIKTDPQYHYYDIPSTQSKRATSFGLGEKNSVFNIKAEGPPSTTYSPTLLDDFEHYAKKSNKKSKGFSFSTGRQNVQATSFIKKNQNPGPGNYNPNPQKVLDKSFYGYSLTKDQRFQDCRQKAKSALEIFNVPGPGFYHVKSTLGGSNKILSQDTNNNPCPRLVLPKNESRRLSTEPDRKIYNPLMTNTGDFVTFNKRKGYTIGKSLRSNLIKSKGVPGPGNYRIFSQFIKSGK